MYRLVCNKTANVRSRHLYKKSGHLVRTPIYKTVTLSPSGQMLYDVGDDYKQILPTSDFYWTSGGGVYANVAGHHMRQSYLGTYTPSHDSSGWRQIWRNNPGFSAANDSGYVFYGGNYSPAKAFPGGASYMRVPGYYFALPSVDSNYEWTVTSAKLTTKSHGIVISSASIATKKTNVNQYPILARDANTTLLPANSDWRGPAQFQVGAFTVSYASGREPFDLFDESQDTISIPNATTDAVSNGGSAGGNAYPLWITWPDRTVVYQDGNIINAPHSPAYATFSLGATFCEALSAIIASNSSFCVTMIPAVADSGGTGTPIAGRDYPFYSSASYGQSMAWWLCERHQITGLELQLAII